MQSKRTTRDGHSEVDAGDGAGREPARLNRRGRRQYDRIFREDPYAANLWLLLFELADARGEVKLGPDSEEELVRLMAERFADPTAHQFRGRRS